MGTFKPALLDGGGSPNINGPSSKPAKRSLYVGALCILFFIFQFRTSIYFFQISVDEEIDYTTMEVGTLKWWPCDKSLGSKGPDCGYLIVPTDYFNETAGVTKLALSRWKATKAPRKGTILQNAGGPGGSTKQFVLQAGRFLQVVMGHDYDIVGFDPRGIGETEPASQCFEAGQYSLFMPNTVLERGFDVGSNLSDPRLRDSLLKQLAEADALQKTQFELCGQRMGEQLRYMGTTSVARDIDFMTTVMEGEDTLINFHGPSYGTILGQYLVNMFPDRIGRVVIDGVADAVAWSNQPNYLWYKTWLSSTELTYDIFLEACSKAGPTGCALAQKENEPAQEIRRRIEDFFDSLLEKPLAVPGARVPTILTSGRARNYLFSVLQLPRIWGDAALALSLAMKGNGTALFQGFNLYDLFPSGESGSSDFSIEEQPTRRVLVPHGDLIRQAVSCNDAVPVKPEEAASITDVIDEYIDNLRYVTMFSMSVVTTEPDSGCQYWPITPPERFSGPWNHTLRNPILIHSNTADPVTPISSGRLVKSQLGDSARLAIQDGPGHSSFFLGSLCTMSITKAFFADGTLPEEGHICPVDEPLFPGSNHTRIFSSEERELLDAATAIGQAMERWHG